MNFSRKTLVIVGAALAIGASAFGCGGDTTSEAASSGAPSSGSSGSSGSSSGAGGAAASEYEQYCQGVYDRDVKCNNMTLPTQVADCLKGEACYTKAARDGVLPVLHKCLVERDCMTIDDTCVTSTDALQPDTASTMAYGKACTDKLAACQMAGTGFLDDYCFDYKIYKDSVLDSMTPCFMGACGMVKSCIYAALEPLFAPCGGM